MSQCVAVKRKGSVEQCPAMAMRGVTLCGRHMRSRKPEIWSTVHKAAPVVRLQALARGWFVRHKLKLKGPGVLRRKDVFNDEDLFTCESKDRKYPIEYFSFEENGRIYWFDHFSLWWWCNRSVEPVNPYTKVPIPFEARKRLRRLCTNRYLLNFATANTAEEKWLWRWNVLSQIFRENGFIDSHPMQFSNFESGDHRAMFVLLERDLQIVLSEKDIYRERLLSLCRRGHSREDTSDRSIHTANILLYMLSIPKDPYILVFSILAAYMRC